MKFRRLMSAIVAVMLFASIAAMANNEEILNNALKETASYGIMKDSAPEGYVTRGEMALISLRLQGIGGEIAPNTISFADVPQDHEYVGAVSTACELGIFGGYPDGNFYPDAHITLWQAIKVITVSLGYEVYSDSMGGYPVGYIAAANKINLLDSLSDTSERELTRGELALILANSLDEYPMERTYGDEVNWKRGTLTVREILSGHRGTQRFEGVVTENGDTALSGNTTVDKNQVKINNAVYNTGNTNIADCLGMNVTVFADKEDGKMIPVITHFYVNESEQRVKNFDADEVTYVAKGVLKAFEDDKEKTFKLSDNASYIYNGKSITPTSEVLEIFDGSYRIADYDNNGVYDVMFVTEKESFVAKKIYYENVYFAGDGRYRGSNGINLEEDEDTRVEIYAPDGTKSAMDSVKAGMGLTLVCSMDKSIIKLYLSDKTVSGTVSGIDETSGSVVIDNQSYNIAKKTDGTPSALSRLGASYTYCLNYEGKIISEISETESEYEYAYVIDCNRIGTFSNYSVQLIGAGSRQSETKTASGMTKVTHKVQNGEIQILEIADKLELNGTKISAEEFQPEFISSKAIAYKKGADGKIRTIKTYDLLEIKTSLKLNTDIFAFGGFLGARNFVVGENTKLICVPENVKTEEDFSVLVTLRDDSVYDVCPIEIDDETMIAEAVILVEDMDSQTPASIDSDVKASIVGKVGYVMDSTETPCIKLQLLTGDKITEIMTSSDSDDVAKLASSLSTGDVIRYSVNAFGKLDNIELLASLYNTKEYFRTNPNTLREKVFGQCYEIKHRRLSEGLNEYVDQITVRYSDSSYADYEVLCEDGPHYYIFERRSGTVMAATSDDVLDYVNVADDASDVYMFVKDSQPQVVVIVKE